MLDPLLRSIQYCWNYRTDIGIGNSRTNTGIGTNGSPKPIMKLVSISLDVQNRYWNCYRYHWIFKTNTGIIIRIVGSPEPTLESVFVSLKMNGLTGI